MNQSLVLMILDVSGSMGYVESEMQESFNKIIEDQSTERGDADLSVFTFSSSSNHDIKPISFKNGPSLTLKTYGCTALYDTVIKSLNSVPTKYQNVLVLIQTDGLDNQSRTSPHLVKHLIHQKIQQGWKFLYMGAEIDVSHEAEKIGLRDYAVKFKRDSKGIEQVFNEMSRKISNFRASLDNNILTPN